MNTNIYKSTPNTTFSEYERVSTKSKNARK